MPGQVEERGQGLALDATIVLRRVGPGEPISLAQVGGSVLFTLRPAARLPQDLESTASQLRVPVTITSTRCSGHEIGEAKKPYEFGAWLGVGADEPRWTLVATARGPRGRGRRGGAL